MPWVPDEVAREKTVLEVEKLRREIAELKRPTWRRPEILGFFGTLIAAILTLLALTINVRLTQYNAYERAQRDAARDLVRRLNSPRLADRAIAGNLLAALDPEVNTSELRAAYGDMKPWARVGTMEALGLGKWGQRAGAMIGFAQRGTEDASVLVRHKALAALQRLEPGPKGLDEAGAIYRKEEQDLAPNVRQSVEKVRLPAGVEVESTMVVVPAMVAVIGSDDFEGREAPAHELPVAAFQIDVREVSNGEWNVVMEGEAPAVEGRVAAGCTSRKWWCGRGGVVARLSFQYTIGKGI